MEALGADDVSAGQVWAGLASTIAKVNAQLKDEELANMEQLCSATAQALQRQASLEELEKAAKAIASVDAGEALMSEIMMSLCQAWTVVEEPVKLNLSDTMVSQLEETVTALIDQMLLLLSEDAKRELSDAIGGFDSWLETITEASPEHCMETHHLC